MAPTAPVGGMATIVLGGDDSTEIFSQYQQQREAVPATPDAAPRFSQIPNASSISLSNEGATALPHDNAIERAPVGGVDNILLGGDDSKEMFTQHKAEREAVVDTPNAALRFSQVPNTSSISISTCVAPTEDITVRGPVGGAATIVLGGDDSKEIFSAREAQREASIETPDAAPRFSQVPNSSSVSIRGDAPTEDIARRGPVGGADTILLGASDEAGNDVVAMRGPVGGVTSICLGNEDAVDMPGFDSATPRGPVGGVDTVILGDDDSKRIFNQRQAQREAVIETGDAIQRFSQVPNSSSVSIRDDAPVDDLTKRGPVGGADTIVLGEDDSNEVFCKLEEQRDTIVDTPAAAPRFAQVPNSSSISISDNAPVDDLAKRGPVAGEDHILLGDADSKEVFRQRMEEREVVHATPDAAQRFQQVRTACSASVDDKIVMRGPIGGVDTVVLGGDDSREIFNQLKEQREAVIETPNAALRFQQDRTACSAPVADDIVMRGPVGGAATLILGEDDPAEIFNQRKEERDVIVQTPNAAQRFQQVPNTSTVDLGNTSARAVPIDEAVATRGPVGGATTIILGGDAPAGPEELFRHHKEQLEMVIETPDAPQLYQQPPGGTATIILGGDSDELLALGGDSCTKPNENSKGIKTKIGKTIVDIPSSRDHHAPGGYSSICLGTDDISDAFINKNSSNAFANAANQNSGNTITDRPTTRIHHAPGGASSICFGSDDMVIEKVSANKFANGSNQNAGNTITERSTTRLHHAPGGASSISLGSDDIVIEKTSANKFANGANQNCGNTITDRPTTRLHHAPGGASSICLGSSDVLTEKVSSNQFASGTNQNCGNVLTDRSSTRLHYAPGGASTICLGDRSGSVGDENVDITNVPQEQDTMKPTKSRQPLSSGTATVVLG